MKKLFYLLTIVCLTFSFVSCKPELTTPEQALPEQVFIDVVGVDIDGTLTESPTVEVKLNP